MLPELLFAAASISKTVSTRVSAEQSPEDSDRSRSLIEPDLKRLAYQLNKWSKRNRKVLCLRSNVPIEVHGFHPVFRVAPNGQLLTELIVQLAQTDRSEERNLGGIPFRGGTTLVASADGTVRYVISKPLPDPRLPSEIQKAAKERLEKQLNYLRVCDMADPNFSYMRSGQLTDRTKTRMNLRFLHQGMVG
jgi:hypothetical protein